MILDKGEPFLLPPFSMLRITVIGPCEIQPFSQCIYSLCGGKIIICPLIRSKPPRDR